VVYGVATAPSANELARALAAAGPGAAPDLLELAGAEAAIREGIETRLALAEAAESASRAPGPLRNPAVLEGLGEVPAYGGTTLERFDVCSYIWFAEHELRPQPLDPVPEPLLQGGLVHEVLDRLYREPPGEERRPRPASLPAWIARSNELVELLAA